ncbi:alpha/beta hydrolase [Rothia sp. AR01]|uniref:Alpha/beta hydrolase n=1 Tax=Rothia santali TaxID=2949643 RepID=A0A9X2HB24_9MICC|nr:alpha/beta hydrolase [Rothia santali]MCP3424865.1 alpha/beta hydrolase [Rothia santali]
MTYIATADGHNLHVEDHGGDGRPVVLIHGWPLSGASWTHQVSPLLAAGHRPITYDRRGFGHSDKPETGYDYDTLAEDLRAVLEGLDLRDVTLVGFSMGGGEVARYVARHGTERLRGVVFAAAVPPYLEQTPDNPDGPLPREQAQEMERGLREDREAFFDDFATGFFTAGEELAVDEETRQEAIALARQSGHAAALGCLEAFATTDFRGDLPAIDVPTLVLHGDSDGTVPFEGSGQRTHDAVRGSRLHIIEGGPHGINASHPEEFNRALLDFLG